MRIFPSPPKNIIELSLIFIPNRLTRIYRLNPNVCCTGTIRSNLDPFSMYDDARLWDALRRSYLVEPTADKDREANLELSEDDDGDEHEPGASGSTTPTSRFTLDTVIESEGANLSVGERSLLSLARALVKDSKVVGKSNLIVDLKRMTSEKRPLLL